MMVFTGDGQVFMYAFALSLEVSVHMMAFPPWPLEVTQLTCLGRQ